MQSRKSLFLAALIFLVSSVLTAAIDLRGLASPHIPVYLAGRIFVIASIAALIILRGRIGAQLLTALLWLVHTVYVCHGQFFAPGYYLGYFQAIIALTFLWEGTQAQMRLLLASGAVAFSTALFMSSAGYESAARFKVDVFFGIFVMNALGLLTHYYLYRERRARDETYLRFAELGRVSAMLMHDIRGLLTAPVACSQILKTQLKDHPEPLVRQILKNLDDSLANVSKLLLETRQLVISTAEPEKIRISEMVERVRNILGNRMRHVQLTIDGELELTAHAGLVMRVLLNIFSNSLDAFHERRVSAPEVRVRCEAATISIEDNGGGYPPDVLKKLNARHQVTTKASGSGIGALIICDSMAAMGGRVSFANGASGAIVKLVFNS